MECRFDPHPPRDAAGAARLGVAWRGWAWPGTARLGEAWQARRGRAWHGAAGHGRQGEAWHDRAGKERQQMRILRVTCFVDWYDHAQLVVVTERDGRLTEHRHEFADAQQVLEAAEKVLEAAEKLRLVGNDMLRHAPRPRGE